MNTDYDWPRMNTDKHGSQILVYLVISAYSRSRSRSVSVVLAGVIKLSWRWIPPAETHGSKIVSGRNIQAPFYLCPSVCLCGQSKPV